MLTKGLCSCVAPGLDSLVFASPHLCECAPVDLTKYRTTKLSTPVFTRKLVLSPMKYNGRVTSVVPSAFPVWLTEDELGEKLLSVMSFNGFVFMSVLYVFASTKNLFKGVAVGLLCCAPFVEHSGAPEVAWHLPGFFNPQVSSHLGVVL